MNTVVGERHLRYAIRIVSDGKRVCACSCAKEGNVVFCVLRRNHLTFGVKLYIFNFSKRLAVFIYLGGCKRAHPGVVARVRIFVRSTHFADNPCCASCDSLLHTVPHRLQTKFDIADK